MAAGIIGRRSRTPNRRSRKLSGELRPQEKPTPIKVTGMAVAASVLTVTFDTPVIVRGVPQYAVTPAGPKPVSAEATSPTTVAITYDAAVATATAVTVPFQDPAVRNTTGSFVIPYDARSLA